MKKLFVYLLVGVSFLYTTAECVEPARKNNNEIEMSIDVLALGKEAIEKRDLALLIANNYLFTLSESQKLELLTYATEKRAELSGGPGTLYYCLELTAVLAIFCCGVAVFSNAPEIPDLDTFINNYKSYLDHAGGNVMAPPVPPHVERLVNVVRDNLIEGLAVGNRIMPPMVPEPTTASKIQNLMVKAAGFGICLRAIEGFYSTIIAEPRKKMQEQVDQIIALIKFALAKNEKSTHKK